VTVTSAIPSLTCRLNSLKSGTTPPQQSNKLMHLPPQPPQQFIVSCQFNASSLDRGLPAVPADQGVRQAPPFPAQPGTALPAPKNQTPPQATASCVNADSPPVAEQDAGNAVCQDHAPDVLLLLLLPLLLLPGLLLAQVVAAGTTP